MGQTHRFSCTLEWTGSIAGPTEGTSFSRDHRISADGHNPIEASSAPAFLGDPERWNPEELLTAALSSCQMLTYLSVMAKSRLPVVKYVDRTEALLEQREDGKWWVSQVTLRPQVTLAPGIDVNRATALVDKAHAHCFIANSVKTAVVIEPTFEHAGGDA